MKNKIRMIKTVFWLPTLVACLRIAATMIVFIWNPTDMPLRFLQIIPFCGVIVYMFMYMFLYMDNLPIAVLIIPNTLHIALVSVLAEELVLSSFVPLVVLDILYIIVKTIKAVAFPFEIEGE